MENEIQQEVRFEPKIALYTNDEDGIEFYKKISNDAPKYLNDNGYLLFELGAGESLAVFEILKNNNFRNIEIIKDFAGIDRVILCQK